MLLHLRKYSYISQNVEFPNSSLCFLLFETHQHCCNSYLRSYYGAGWHISDSPLPNCSGTQRPSSFFFLPNELRQAHAMMVMDWRAPLRNIAASYVKDGAMPGLRDEARALLESSGQMRPLRMSSKYVGVYPQNRFGDILTPARVHELFDQIYQMHWSTQPICHQVVPKRTTLRWSRTTT